jgi:hypothetical protein
MKRRSFLTILGSALFTGCELGHLTGPPSPKGSRRITDSETLSIYEGWWGAMEQCTGKKKDFSDVWWYTVSGKAFPCIDGGGMCVCGHLLWLGRREVYIAEDYHLNKKMVCHEIIEILDSDIEDGDPLFEKCGAYSGIWPEFQFYRR